MSEDDSGKIPPGLLFYKQMRIVAPASIREKLIRDVHGTGHWGIIKTYNGKRSLFCRVVSRVVNPCKLAYHPLQTAHRPCKVIYMDLLGPITGIRSNYYYILTTLDGFSRLLATRLIKDRKAAMVTATIHSIFSQEMGFPSRFIVDRGSKFTTVDTRALVEMKLGVKMTFIPAGEH